MRCVVQRSGPARVDVAGRTVGSIDGGLVVLAAFSARDTERELEWMAEKLIRLRVFNDEEGRMNLALSDVGGGILLISQFTLYGNIRKGTRPSFTDSAPGEQARTLYERFGEMLRRRWDEVAEGEFGAHMQVSLVNDGPVTLILEREAPGEDAS